MEVTNSTGPIVNFQGEHKIPAKEHKINLSGKTDNSIIIYNETATDGNRAQPLKQLFETLFLAIKKCAGFTTDLWRGTEFQKAVLKAKLCFHRYVHFACVPIYIFGPHHKQCASD